MTSIPCDVVILPSDELAQRIIALSKKLQTHNSLFTLDGQNFYPHSTLYMTQLKLESLDEISALLADIAANLPPFDLTATNYAQAKGYLDLEYRHTKTLDQLQMAVIEAVNPLRDGIREKDQTKMLEAVGFARDNFEKYGYQYVGKLFRPHSTITRFENDKVIDTKALPDHSQFSGQFVKLGLFEMGDNGTCVRELVAFKLM